MAHLMKIVTALSSDHSSDERHNSIYIELRDNKQFIALQNYSISNNGLVLVTNNDSNFYTKLKHDIKEKVGSPLSFFYMLNKNKLKPVSLIDRKDSCYQLYLQKVLHCKSSSNDNGVDKVLHDQIAKSSFNILYAYFEKFTNTRHYPFNRSLTKYLHKETRFYINLWSLWSKSAKKVHEKCINKFVKVINYVVKTFVKLANLCGSTYWRFTWEIIPVMWLIQFLGNSRLNSRSIITSKHLEYEY